MSVTINGTTGVVFPDGVTQGSGVPTASATSGAPLVSNGTIYTQNTAVAVAFGGTGATDAATARSNLGTNDAANITTGTLSSSRLPTTGVNAASITTGTLAVANGGTGTSSPSLVGGTNITISGAWPNQTVTAAGGGVTSLNGQTGAITNTSTNTIGSYAIGATLTSNGTYGYGDTVAGSTLRMISRTSSGPATYGIGLGILANDGTTFVNPSLTGTWRAMSRSKNQQQSCCNDVCYLNIWVRVS